MPRHSRHMRHRRHIRHDRHDPLPVITAVGAVQYSADGTTWADSIPVDTMKVDTALNFFVRPKTVTPADTGFYTYNFAIAAGTGDGLSLTNVSNGVARISGTAPAGMVGKTFSVNVTVTDKKGNAVVGTALTQAWAA